MKITTTTKYGGSAKESRDGFKLAAEAEISQEQLPILASIGLASILYRGGASVMNEALKVRSNSESEFNDADAAKLVTAVVKWARGEDSPLKGGFELKLNVSRHVHGEGTEPKFVGEKKMINRHIASGDIDEWALDKVGYKGDGQFDTDNVEFMKAVKAYIQRLVDQS